MLGALETARAVTASMSGSSHATGYPLDVGVGKLELRKVSGCGDN